MKNLIVELVNPIEDFGTVKIVDVTLDLAPFVTEALDGVTIGTIIEQEGHVYAILSVDGEDLEETITKAPQALTITDVSVGARAHERIEQARTLLAEAGANPESLAFQQSAISQAGDLIVEAMDMVEKAVLKC